MDRIRFLRRSRLPRAVLATLFVALLAATQLASELHLVVVRHRVCLEHAGVEHLDEARDRAEPPGDARPGLPEERPEEGEHEACDLGAFQRHEPLAPLPTPSTAPGPLAVATTTTLRAAEGRAPVALLRLAPSHSPPA